MGAETGRGSLAGVETTAPGLVETTAPPPAPDGQAATRGGLAPGARPPAPAAGDLPRIGRFIVLRELGRGAMGVVFAGYDEELDRKVALKLVQLDAVHDASHGRNQLLREAQALARLSHPNVVAVHEAGVHAGAVFIAMEYVAGVDLQAWLSLAARGWREVVGAFVQAGEGLLSAHRVGLVHRDFKPSNVLVGEDGRVRVADFGLASRRERISPQGHGQNVSGLLLTGSSRLDGTIATAGALIGTPAYMAPEQHRREPATALSDQFAFCVALFEALYGYRPFRGDTLEALADEVLRVAPPPAPPDPAVPAWLHAILLRGLAKDPARRFATMDDLLALLRRDPDGERRRRRQRLAQLLGAVALTLFAVLGGASIYRGLVRDAHERRAQARLVGLREQLAELRARGRDDEAAQLFAAFVALPDNRGTAALARAYREWAELQTDDAAAVDAYAGAYIHTGDPAAQTEALRGLTLRLAAKGAFAEAAVALATLDQRAPELHADPDLTALRLAAALDRRDLAGVRQAIGLLDPSDPLRAYGPVLEHLSSAIDLPRAALGHDAGEDRPVDVLDVDGDGRRELATHAPRRGEGTIVVVRADPSLTHVTELRTGLRGLILPRLIPRALAGAPLVLADGDEPDGSRRLRLLPLDGRPSVHVWEDSKVLARAVLDLDGDGASELYVGTGPYMRRLTRLDPRPDGTWDRRPAHPSTDAVRSDITAVAGADLDGDGGSELVVAAGAWTAYDLRIFRAGAGGELELVARRTLGTIRDLALVRDGGRTLIAALKTDEYPNPDRFPAARPAGEPAGLHVLGFDGRELSVREFFPDPSTDSDPRVYWDLRAGDLDGDGRDDLVIRGIDTMTLLLRGDNRFLPPLRLRGLDPVAVADFDGDPADEILVRRGDARDVYTLLGAGGPPLPPAPAAEFAAEPVPADITDPALADAWRSAEELAAIGLPRRSAEELAVIARLSDPVHEGMLLRSAELHAAAGAHREAADLFLAAAERPALADAALSGAIRSARARGDFAAAVELAARRAALPDLDPDARADADAELTLLRRATDGRARVDLRFGEPLDPRWRVLDPLAVRRDPGSKALTFQTSVRSTVAELPLEWDGAAAVLALDVEIDHLGWGSTLAIALTAAEAEALPWIGVLLGAGGQTDRPSRSLTITNRNVHHELLPEGTSGRIRVRLADYPELDATVIELEIPGRPVERLLRPSLSSPGPGPVRLRLLSTAHESRTTGQIRIHALELTGLRPVVTGPGDDAAEVARQIADNDLDTPLRRLATATNGEHVLWRAVLLARTGDVDASGDALRGLPRELRPALVQRLQHEPDLLALAARRGLGDELLDHLHQPDLVSFTASPAFLAHVLAALATFPRDPPRGKDPVALGRHVAALLTRALALRRAARDDLARGDLEALWSIVDDPTRAFPDGKALRRPLLRHLLDVALALRDAPAVRRWSALFVAESPSPAIALEQLRLRPGLVETLGAADWAALAAIAPG